MWLSDRLRLRWQRPQLLHQSEGVELHPVQRREQAGADRFAAGLVDPLDTPARARWPLDPGAEPVRGAGVKA